MAMREGRFSAEAYETLAETTIRGAVSNVVSTFRDNDRPNPSRDGDGEFSRLLSRLFRSFRNKDPEEKQQAVALPMRVLIEMAKLQATETQSSTFQIAIGAIYLCMRSCEYLKVPQSEKKRTDIVRLRNIILKRNNKILRHDDPNLEYADSVTIVFEKQKKDEKSDKVTQHKTTHVLMNPPCIWAAIVKRIRSYPGATDDTPVSAVWRNNKIVHITGKEMIDAIDRAALAIGYEKLGIKRGDFGTHSIRSGGSYGDGSR